MEVQTSRIRLVLLAAIAASLLLAVVSSSSAQAAWSPYCNNQKLEPGNQQCIGAPRTLHAVWGYGDQHSVCVWSKANAAMCSSGPGVAVYNPNPEQFYWIYADPAISNNATGWNIVHGSAEVP